jgi:hypothetical protein
MKRDSSQVDGVVLGPGVVASAVTPDATVTLPRLGQLGGRVSLRLPRVALPPQAAKIALATLLASTLLVVVFSTAAPSLLVPASQFTFPHWFSGPLHGLFGHLTQDPMGLSVGLSILLVTMGLAYGVALAAVRTLSMRTIAVCVVALHAILLLGPPLPLTDIFNYLGYARLGALHHLNPYTHVIGQAAHDPVYRFTSWHNLHSPYGPAFTAATYPLAFLPLPVAYWVLKVVTVAASLGVIALVARIARQLGHDPRFAVLFVAANPVTLLYAVGGFHNDVFMLLPLLGSISLLLDRRDRSAGAMLMLAVAVKFTGILLLPFLLLAARPSKRRLQLLIGAGMAALPLVLGSIALFGLSIPNLSDQSTLLTGFSLPNMFGVLIGVGGGVPLLLKMANVAVVLVVAWHVRRRTDWLVGAGWATFALIASLAWLVPWYVIWLLPLAALASSLWLRRAALALTAYLVLAFMPATGVIFSHLQIDPMSGSAGQASQVRQQHLER